MRTLPSFVLVIATILFSGTAPDSLAQRPNPLEELRQRAQQMYVRNQVNSFVDNVYEFYEIGGELISFRVHPNMTAEELALLAEKSKQLDARAGDLISFIRFASPGVRGNTDNLWVILEPLDETASVDDRLTLILSLFNSLEPKIDHLIEVMDEVLNSETAEPGATIDIEELRTEAALPYLIVGGLEELQSMIRDLGQAL